MRNARCSTFPPWYCRPHLSQCTSLSFRTGDDQQNSYVAGSRPDQSFGGDLPREPEVAARVASDTSRGTTGDVA
jgi:hypothetical protein